jgi:RES domain
MDSEGLLGAELLTEHTVFPAEIHGTTINLQDEPWSQSAQRWVAPDDYSATQALSDEARQRSVQWIAYASVRAPGGICAVVFDPAALVGLDLTSQQTWHCRTTRDGSRMVHESDRFEWHYGTD